MVCSPISFCVFVFFFLSMLHFWYGESRSGHLKPEFEIKIKLNGTEEFDFCDFETISV